MRLVRIWMILLISNMLLLAACTKKDHVGNTAGTGKSLTEAYFTGAEAINTLLQYGADHKTDAVTSLHSILESIKKQPEVAGAEIQDNTVLVINLKNGLQTVIALNFLDADGNSVARGNGDGYYRLEGVTEDANKRHVVKNKRILFYSPPFDEFYSGKNAGQDKELEKIAVNSGKAITFDRVTGYSSKPSIIKSFKDYGLVIMSTHGVRFGYIAASLKIPGILKKTLQPNGVYKFQRTEVNTEEEIKKLVTANNEAGVYESLLKKDMITMFDVKIKEPYTDWVTKVNQYIGNSQTDPAYLIVTTNYLESVASFDSTIVFGNMCYSGATNNGKAYISDGESGGHFAIRDGMIKKNPWAYYCWVPANIPGGVKVDNQDAIFAEQAFLKSMLVDMDTTGNAVYSDAGAILWARESRHPSNSTKSDLTLFGKDNVWYGCGSGQFTDERDGNVYKTVCIDGKEWMAENLRFNSAGSVAYNNNPANAAKYGRLYTLPAMMSGQASSDAVPSGVRGICPKGWHIPSAPEFDKMINSLGGLQVAAKKMMAKTDWNTPGFGTNESGLNILPAGMYNPGVNFGFSNLGKTENLRSSSTVGPGGAWTYSFDDGNSDVRKTNYSGTSSYGDPWYFSCRCAKD